MMNLRPYKPEDFETVARWARDGYNTEYSEDQFPQTGFIVDGVAAAFMYATDSSVCYIENMISNRSADPAARDYAIKLILEALFLAARSQGFKVAYATTDLATMIFRAAQHGARVRPNQSLVTKLLTIDPS